jgi:hypothetical protein
MLISCYEQTSCSVRFQLGRIRTQEKIIVMNYLNFLSDAKQQQKSQSGKNIWRKKQHTRFQNFYFLFRSRFIINSDRFIFSSSITFLLLLHSVFKSGINNRSSIFLSSFCGSSVLNP